MDFSELKNKSAKDLQELLAEKRGKLRDLSFQASGTQLKNVRDIRQIKKAIARILTVLSSNKAKEQSK